VCNKSPSGFNIVQISRVYNIPQSEHFAVISVWEHLTTDARSNHIVMRFSAEVEWMTTPWLPGVVSITEGQIDGEMETGAKTYHDWHLGKVKDWKSKQ